MGVWFLFGLKMVLIIQRFLLLLFKALTFKESKPFLLLTSPQQRAGLGNWASCSQLAQGYPRAHGAMTSTQSWGGKKEGGNICYS